MRPQAHEANKSVNIEGILHPRLRSGVPPDSLLLFHGDAADLHMDPMRTVRIFLSSPGDVAAERIQARELLLGLARGPFMRGRVHIDVITWDDPHGGATMDARFTPQEAVTHGLPTPAECDLTVVLLWGRMGTPLIQTKADGTAYLSGTEWEFENALTANKPVLVYRRSDKLQVDLDDPEIEDKLAQKRRVDAFFDRFEDKGGTIRRAYSTYASTDDLLDRLRQDVERYLSAVVPESAFKTPAPALAIVSLRRAPVPRDVPLPTEPYPLLGPYTHALTFAGRDREIETLAAQVALPPLVLCVHAASGAGKSSLLWAGLVPRLREEGYAVSLDRAPGDPKLAERLLKDVLEPEEAIELTEDDEGLPRTFARWVGTGPCSLWQAGGLRAGSDRRRAAERRVARSRARAHRPVAGGHSPTIARCTGVRLQVGALLPAGVSWRDSGVA